MEAPAESITIDFEITRDDYIAWTGWLREQPKQAAEWAKFYRKRRDAVLCAAIITVAVGVIGYNKLPDIVDRADHWTALLLVMFVGGLVGYWWYVSRLLKVNSGTIEEQRQRDADSEQGRLWQGPKRVTVAAESFRWEAVHCTWITPWNRVRRVWREWAFVLVDMGDQNGWPIPVRAFADESAADRFVALANQYRVTPSGSAEHVRAVLRERDVKCAGCGYNLRGSDGAKCPECGRAVGIGDVLKAG